MRVLVTGGAGFVGANLCSLWRASCRLGARRARQPPAPRIRAQPAAAARCRRAVRPRRRAPARGPLRASVRSTRSSSARPSRRCSPGSTAARLRRRHEPGRRVQLPRAVPPRRRAARLPLDQPRLSRRGARAPAPTRRPTRASSSLMAQPVAGRLGGGIAEDFPLDGARTLYGATKLAAELLMAEYADAFGLRAVVNRCGVIAGPVADGQGRPGRLHALVLAHHFGRPLSYIGFGGRASRCATCCTSTTWSTWSTSSCCEPERGRAGLQRRRRARGLALAAGADRALPRAHGQAAGRPAGRPAGRRPNLRLRLLGLFAHTDWRPAQDPRIVLEDISHWSQRTSGARCALGLTVRPMPIAIVTGSGGLIGSESGRDFVEPGFDVIGIDNDMRARLLRPEASTAAHDRRLRSASRRVPLARRSTSATSTPSIGSSREHGRRSSSSSTPRRSPPTTGRRRSADGLHRQRQRHAEPARGSRAGTPRGDVHLHLDQQGLRRPPNPSRWWSSRRAGAARATIAYFERHRRAR